MTSSKHGKRKPASARRGKTAPSSGSAAKAPTGQAGLALARRSRGRVRADALFSVPPPRVELPHDYVETLGDIKRRIQQERLRVVMAASSAMVRLYWDVGRIILDRQHREGWGARVIDRLSLDLRDTYPEMQGLSPRNLKYMRAFAAAWSDARIVQRVVARLPWRHNIALLELGSGFAFVGRQVHLEVGTHDYYVDLLFYHLKLRCYVVIELKAVPFEPAFVGQINLHLSAVDDLLRHTDDKPTIGLLLCRSKDRIVVEYALRDLDKPIGVAEWETKIVETLPEDLRGSLPTVEEIEAELATEPARKPSAAPRRRMK